MSIGDSYHFRSGKLLIYYSRSYLIRVFNESILVIYNVLCNLKALNIHLVETHDVASNKKLNNVAIQLSTKYIATIVVNFCQDLSKS